MDDTTKTGKKSVETSENIYSITVEPNPNQLALMIGHLVSMSSPIEKTEEISQTRKAFGSVVKGFSPEIQKYLLGETPGAYWLIPEVKASVEFLQNSQNFGGLLPGETSEPIKQNRVVFKRSSRNISGNVTFGRHRDQEVSPDSQRQVSSCPASQEKEELDQTEFSANQKRLNEEGFLFNNDNHDLNRLILRASSQYSDIPVVLVGPVGVGKSHLARVLHDCYWEGRPNVHPLVEVNCAQLDGNLAESVLFGHAKGAFTGASSSHTGYFQQADQGTLFLDEFEELPLTIQAKLLQNFEPGDPLVHKFRPIGDQTNRTSIFRVLLATNVDPRILIKEKRLRSDFYSRLGPHVIRLPLLTQNPQSIIPLFWKILNRIKARKSQASVLRPVCLHFDPEAKELLESWFVSDQPQWPNNRRDLVHCANELLILAAENNGRINVKSIESLIETMTLYWENEEDTAVLTFSRKDSQLNIRFDYSAFLEICCGPDFISRINPELYMECFRLIWVNLIGGSARQAGMIYYNNKYQNPTKKMKDLLRKCGLLQPDEKYETMLKTLQERYLKALEDNGQRQLFAEIFKQCPVEDNVGDDS